MFELLEKKAEEEIREGIVSDVCFAVGQREDVRLYGSKASLALASPVFHAMFFSLHGHVEASGITDAPGGQEDRYMIEKANPLSRSLQARQYTHVCIPDVDPNAFRSVLRYVNHLDPQLTLDNSLHVYRAADKYQIEGLLDACALFLDSHIDPRDADKVLRLFDIACRLGLEKYSQRFLDELGELTRLQTARLLMADEFVLLHITSVATLLRSSSFCVDEEPLWCALRRWAEMQMSASDRRPEMSPEVPEDDSPALCEPWRERTWSGGSCIPATWQEQLRPLKQYIRFPVMSRSFFAEEIAQSGVLDPSEVIAIFCHLTRTTGRPAANSALASELVAETFLAEPRIPQLQWCRAPGTMESLFEEELGVGVDTSLSPLGSVSVVVADGSAMSLGSWGPRIVLGGSGAGFHFAFGSVGFSSGVHSWTITWRPLDGVGQPAGARRGLGRGGAAGIAFEEKTSGEHSPTLPMATSFSGAGAGQCSSMGPAQPKSVIGVGGVRTSSGQPGTVSVAGNNGAVPPLSTEAEPSSRFSDWPTCIVFGTKREVSEKRYVAWDPDASDASSANGGMKFAIVIDFPARTVTYLADRGERRWTAPLANDTGRVYPVIASSTAHYFQIQYGVHI
jgi:hypothetical protein